jgi:hypothetical protein
LTINLFITILSSVCMLLVLPGARLRLRKDLRRH